MDFLPLFVDYLAAVRLNGVTDVLVLGASTAVTLFSLAVVYRLVRRIKRRIAGHKSDRPRLGLVFTVITALMALGVSYQGMLHFFEQLGMSGWVLYFFCGFIEFGLVTSALLSREFKLEQAAAVVDLEGQIKRAGKDSEEAAELRENLEEVRGEADQAGRAVWALAILAGVLAATKADHGLGEVLLRLAAPLVAALFWDWALRADIRKISIRKAAKTWADDLRDLVDRILIFFKIKKPTSLNASQRAEEQQINTLVEASFQLKGLNTALEAARKDADEADAKRQGKASKRVADLTASQFRAVKRQQKAALTLMELGLWTPTVEHVVNIRLDAMFNLEGLADAETVAERAADSRAALAAEAVRDGDFDVDEPGGFESDWRVDTGELEAVRDGDYPTDAPVSPAGGQPGAVRGQVPADTRAGSGQRTADSTGTARGQRAAGADSARGQLAADNEVSADSKRGQDADSGRGQRSPQEVAIDDQLAAAYRDLLETHTPDQISSRKLAAQASSESVKVGKTKANDWLSKHVRNNDETAS